MKCSFTHKNVVECSLPLPPTLSTQEVEDLPLSDPNLAVLITNSEYRHTLAQSSTKGDRDYSSRRKMCEAISQKLGVQWLRDLKWKELEGGLML